MEFKIQIIHSSIQCQYGLKVKVSIRFSKACVTNTQCEQRRNILENIKIWN